MSNITAALVAELRNRTGAGMMDCKKALVEAAGDIELAIENMRKSGQAKAAKKAGNIAAEGVILVRISPDYKKGILLEVNCQTDFVAKDAGFLAFANKVADDAINSGATLEELNSKYEEERTQLIAKIGENITIRRLSVLAGSNLGSYSHGTKIAVLVDLEKANDELAKKIAMHIAASRPEFVNPSDVSDEVVANEKRIQLEIMLAANAAEQDERKKKSEEMLVKIIEGKMNKFANEISLTGQNFVMDPAKSVGAFLKSESNAVISFVRNEVGEGIEKVATDFAAEVAAMTGK